MPAITAPIAYPRSRQKRYAPMADARRDDDATSPMAASGVGVDHRGSDTWKDSAHGDRGQYHVSSQLRAGRTNRVRGGGLLPPGWHEHGYPLAILGVLRMRSH
jgi:hypothetical protein